MAEAAASAGLDRRFWYRQPRGDGELAVLPADANGVSLVAEYPRSFASAVLRQALRQRTDVDIALIVSGAVYREIVQSRFNELDPKLFQRTLVRIKGNSCIGYLYCAS